jgi:hypothetical protein
MVFHSRRVLSLVCAQQSIIICNMQTSPYCVFVVLDREYGGGVAELVHAGPVWMVDSTTNRAAARNFWVENPERSELDGVTVFTSVEGMTAEAVLIAELDTIDLHHGEHSADPPYSVVEVIGTPITDAIKREFSRFGFDEFCETTVGFRAGRSLPE